MRRPPIVVVLVAVLVIALGETAGAVMSLLRPQVAGYARARIAASASAHGLAGSPEYDNAVTERAVYTAEAGLSFFHTHAQGLGPLVLLVATVTATVVRWRWARAVLHTLFTAGGFFPVGYLVYSLASLERGRDPGIELAERYVLAPLGSAVIVGLLALAALMLVTRRSPTPS